MEPGDSTPSVVDAAAHGARHRVRGRSAGALALLAGVVLAVVAPAAASGSGMPPTVPGGPGLTIAVDALPEDARTMSPGERRHWGITVQVAGVRDPVLAVRVDREGELARHPAGLVARLEACAEPWTSDGGAPRCTPGAVEVMPSSRRGPAATAPVFELPRPGGDGRLHLLATLGLEDTDAARTARSLMGLSSDVGLTVTAWAEGEEDGAHALEPTGGRLVGLVPAAVLLVAGLVAISARRRESPPVLERRMGASCRPRRAPPR